VLETLRNRGEGGVRGGGRDGDPAESTELVAPVEKRPA
jgi:hypothetical protein